MGVHFSSTVLWMTPGKVFCAVVARHYLDGLVFATRPKTMTGLSSKARNTLLPRVAAAALGVLPPARADSLLTLASLEVTQTTRLQHCRRRDTS